jgi:hypothetical protein
MPLPLPLQPATVALTTYDAILFTPCAAGDGAAEGADPRLRRQLLQQGVAYSLASALQVWCGVVGCVLQAVL